MAVFRGSKNLHLGSDPEWVSAVYDHATHGYVVTLEEADAEHFRPLAAGYGYVEDSAPVEQPEPEAEPEAPADPEPSDEDVEDDEPVSDGETE